MDTAAAFGLKELLTHVIGGIVNAVSERPGESQQQQLTRSLAAAHTVMEFQPGSAIGAMLAGHCVMFHEMIVDDVHATMRGEAPSDRRATRANIVAMDKAFGNSLTRLERHRQAEALERHQQAEAPPETHNGTETEIANRVDRHHSRTPGQQLAENGPSATETETIPRDPSPQVAQEAPGTGRSVLGVGTDQRGQAWHSTGHPSETRSPDPRLHAGPYRGNRQARRHPNP